MGESQPLQVGDMEKFILRRVFTMLLVLLGVSFLTYATMFLAPGDPAELILQRQMGDREPTEEQIREFREEHGMNDPFIVRYGRWLWDALHGDLGKGYFNEKPVANLIVDRVPQTAELAVAAMFIALLIAFPAGIISAVHKGQFPDYLSQFAALLGLSMPNFWLAYLLIIVFSLHIQLFPVAGVGGLNHLVLPAVTIGTGLTAILTRLLRSSMLEVLNEEYIRTARSKGLPERIVVYKHAVRTALIPILTVVGLSFGALLNGTVIVEVIFQRPGLGSLFVTALLNRNYPVVQASVLVTATIFVVTNSVVDILYRYIDPRIELAGREP